MQFAPYRIEKRSAISAYVVTTEDKAASYVERLTRLIPAEVLGLYLTFRGMAAPDTVQRAAETSERSDSFTLLWPVICLMLVILSRIWGSLPPGTSFAQTLQKAQWLVVGISAVSFVLWVYATGDNFFGIVIEDQRWIGAAVGVWTFVVPWFYKGTEPAKP